MGGGTSLVLQDNMSLDFLKEFSGDKFDEVKYNALRDDNGEVSKDLLMSTVVDGIAREVYTTYISYCPTGYMSVGQYVKLLRNAKFLNKKNNRPCAEVLYHAARFAKGETEVRINYNTFINDILPKLAQEREVETALLFDKLAFVELDDGKESNTAAEVPTSLAASLYMATAAVASNSEKALHPEKAPATAAAAPTPAAAVSTEQQKAATLMQKKARARNAKRQVEELRKIKTIRGEKKALPAAARYPKVENPADVSAIIKPHYIQKTHTVGDMNELDRMDSMPAELILEEVFHSYCNIPGEMDANSCKKMFRENNVLSKKFTAVDIDIIFRKTVAKILASADDNPLREGVIFEKRVTYPVFRAEIVGQAAHTRGMTLDAFLELLKKNYIAMNRHRCSEHDHGLAPGNV